MEEDNRKAFALLEVLYAGRDALSLRRYAEDPTVPSDVRTYASALLMRPWLPWGARRQLLMFVFAAGVVVTALVLKSCWALFLMIVPLSFSPRLVAETLVFCAKVRRKE